MRKSAILNISCSRALEAAARARAESLGLTLSKYVQVLLDQDVRRGGSLTIPLQSAAELAPFGLTPGEAAATAASVHKHKAQAYAAQAKATAGAAKKAASSA
jgi:antitoxin component of RelBE/YafQ-DinJ toxin-antitoxin module